MIQKEKNVYLPTEYLTKFLLFEQDWIAQNTHMYYNLNPISRRHFYFLCSLKQTVVSYFFKD